MSTGTAADGCVQVESGKPYTGEAHDTDERG